MSGERISTPADAAALIWAVLPKEEIIVAHNHPSGNLTPSKADLAATKELKTLAKRLGVPLLDHLVIGPRKEGDFVSLAERERIG